MTYYNQKAESLSRDEITSLQTEKLKVTLKTAYKSEFYKKRFDKNKIDIEEIKTLDDLKHIPFTTKDDLRDSYPQGMLAVPMDKVVRMHASSGTTGKPTVIYHSQKDLDNWTDLVARSLYMSGMRKSDVFQNMMTYGLFTGGLGLHYGAEKLGMMVIPISSGNSRRQVQMIEDFHTTAVHITPSYALHLAEDLVNYGVKNPRDLGLRFAVMGGEPYSEMTAKKIEDIYGVHACNCYGLSEMNGPGVAFDCEAKLGMHVWEDNYIVEIINPDTLEHVKEGEEGELVLTHINREAMPILRYRTKDITSFIKGNCSCGRKHIRIKRIIGRNDDMLIINGVNIFPSQVEHVLMDMPEVANNYIIIVSKDHHLDRLTVKTEVKADIFQGDIDNLMALQKRIEGVLKSNLLISARVDLVEPLSLEASTGKAVRVIDERKNKL